MPEFLGDCHRFGPLCLDRGHDRENHAAAVYRQPREEPLGEPRIAVPALYVARLAIGYSLAFETPASYPLPHPGFTRTVDRKGSSAHGRQRPAKAPVQQLPGSLLLVPGEDVMAAENLVRRRRHPVVEETIDVDHVDLRAGADLREQRLEEHDRL